ncbi:ribbon-helix-helix protein, CopG family [Streptomyces sp. NPDC005356]
MPEIVVQLSNSELELLRELCAERRESFTAVMRQAFREFAAKPHK